MEVVFRILLNHPFQLTEGILQFSQIKKTNSSVVVSLRKIDILDFFMKSKGTTLEKMQYTLNTFFFNPSLDFEKGLGCFLCC